MLSMASVGHPAAIPFRLVERLIPRPAHDRASPGMATKSIDDVAVNDMGDKKGNSLYTLPDSKRLLRDWTKLEGETCTFKSCRQRLHRRVSHRSLEAELSSSKWHQQCGTERACGHGRRRALKTACRDDWRRRNWVCIHVVVYL
jgi:hypothetical protein